jgi:hypothetical protein
LAAFSFPGSAVVAAGAASALPPADGVFVVINSR